MHFYNYKSKYLIFHFASAAMTNITGDFFHAVTEMSKVLNVRGRVLPAANTSGNA